MDKELEEHLKMWDGTPYDMALVEDVYDLGYGIGKKHTTQRFKDYLEKKKNESMTWIKRQAFWGNDAYRIKENEERIKFIDEIINELFKED